MTGFNPAQLQVELPKKKYKILTLCDHPLSTSGVGVQAGALFHGLLKTGKYSFRSLGGALKHSNYDVQQPHPDMIIKPVDNFGTKQEIRQLLLTERPDAVFIFTDPRQFIWVWEMEDEIHQICPIVYWHVWDNEPYPAFNKVWYDSTDLINCLAYKTYELVQPHYPEKTHYIPHTFPKEAYFPIPEEALKPQMQEQFGHRADWFKVLWVNRNATRKLPADVMTAFKKFLDALEQKHGHRKACLVMHTDPLDMEGPNLYEVNNMLGTQENVMFSTDKLPTEGINLMHNMCDVLINIAKAEGFGLSTLIHMMVGKPIIALETGGMIRQVRDYRDGSENGVAIPPAARQVVGSQMVPYIYEDFSNHDQVVNALMKIYEMTPDEKVAMKKKVLDYVDHEFKYENMIQRWDETLDECIKNFKVKKTQTWELKTIENPNPPKVVTKEEQTRQVLQQNQIVVDSEVAKLPIDLTGYLLKNIKITKGAK